MMIYKLTEQPALERAEIVEAIARLLKSRGGITTYDAMAHTGLSTDDAAEAIGWFIARGYAEVAMDHDPLGWLKRIFGREPTPPRVHTTPQFDLVIYRGTAKIHQTPSGVMVINAVFPGQEDE